MVNQINADHHFQRESIAQSESTSVCEALFCCESW